MRTVLLISFFASLVTGSTLAQPTLNLFDLTPSLDDQITSSVTQWVQMDDGGANQTWDYSSLTADQSFTLEYITPNNAPNINLFPEATHVSSAVEFAQYGYSSYADNLAEIVGADQAGMLNLYPNPRTLLEFPLTYNSTFQDTFEREADLGGGAANLESGPLSAVCDAYGTLIIPSGTYTDVVRVKYTVTSTLDVLVNGEVVSSINSTETTYSFFAAGIPAALLSMVEFNFGGQISTTATMYSGGSLSIEEDQLSSSLNIYPNPATDFVIADFELDNSQSVNANLLSLDGRVVKQYSTQNFGQGTNRMQLKIPEISSGVYLLQLQAGETIIHRKILIE